MTGPAGAGAARDDARTRTPGPVRSRARPNNADVGLLREGSLHAALKLRYAGADGAVEAIVDGFVVDVIAGDGEIVEIQTGSFASARRKFEHLVEQHRLRVVYPIVATRWIVTLVDAGHVVGRRRSPMKALPHVVFDELVHLGRLVAHPGFVLELAFTVEEEIREPMPPGRRRWPRTWRRIDRRLLDVVGTVVVADPCDLRGLIPGGLPDRYTTRDLVAAFGGRRRLAQRAAYCLRLAGVAEVVGREGGVLVYERVGAGAAETGGSAAIGPGTAGVDIGTSCS